MSLFLMLKYICLQCPSNSYDSKLFHSKYSKNIFLKSILEKDKPNKKHIYKSKSGLCRYFAARFFPGLHIHIFHRLST